MADLVFHDLLAIPEVVDLAITFNGASDASCYWSWPKTRSATIYDGSFWSAVNLADFAATAVNDGELGGIAWRWIVGGASYLVFDAGAGNTKSFREFWCSSDSTVSGDAPSYWYADDPAGPWTSISTSPSGMTQTINHGSNIVTSVRRCAAAVGAHRCWRAGDSSVAEAGAFTEMWFREYGEDFHDDVDAFLIYDGNGVGGGVAGLHAFVAANKTPTAAAPINLSRLVRVTESFAEVAEALAFEVRVLTESRGESVGWRYTSAISGANGTFRRSDYRVQASQGSAIANGLNSNIAIPSGPQDMTVLPGQVSANFSLGGFLRGDPGGVPAGTPVVFSGSEIFRVWNWSSYTMAVVHESGSSDAANRIKVLSGSNVNIVGNGYAEFQYDATSARWVYVCGRDSTGLK